MKTSLITFESIFRDGLLDLIYAQWRLLGAPFSSIKLDLPEVIDPESLLWCSLEFAPTEPRLLCQQQLSYSSAAQQAGCKR